MRVAGRLSKFGRVGSANGDGRLDAHELKVHFGGVHAVDGVDLELRQGEILGLIGPNGAGKTTLVNALSGFQKPSSGRVALDGIDVTGWSPHHLARRGLARTFQSVRLFPGLTVLENVELGGVGVGMRRSAARRAARELLERLNLAHLADALATGLPHGLERRLGMLRALAAKPQFLLLDEPAAGLNERESDELVGALTLVRDDFSCGLIVIEHDMRVIMQLCERIQVLDYGKTISTGTPAQVRADPVVLTAYLGGGRSMLAVADLRVNYGRVPALHGISLNVNEGEAVALVGPNGAGKTTTLSAIFGLVRPESGTITFEGGSLLGLAPENIVRKGLALVPEGRHIFGTLTVAENLKLGATARKQHRLGGEIEQTLERFPALAHYYGSSAGTLSGGEQQQLAIARALLSRPRLLLLDEPSLGLAPLVIDTVFDALDELRQEGVTILLVEQNATRAVEFADRAYILRSGLMAHSGTTEEMRALEDFETLYLGV